MQEHGLHDVGKVGMGRPEDVWRHVIQHWRITSSSSVWSEPKFAFVETARVWNKGRKSINKE